MRKAEKAERIARSADGWWDVARVRAAWRANADSVQQRAGLGIDTGYEAPAA